MADWYLLSVLAFVAVMTILLWKDRKNIEQSYGILFMRRTERFKSTIYSIADSFPIFWKLFSTIGILVCFLAMIFGICFLLDVGVKVASGLYHEPQIQLLLPTPTSVGFTFPGFVFFPFWTWIIVILMVLIPHELSHGIITRNEKLKLKSVGLILLAVLPGAFVEPDEKKLKRAPMMSKMRIYAAGSFANFIVAGIILFATMFMVWPAVTLPGLTILDVNATGPAALAGLENNQIINSVNGIPVTNSYSEFFLAQDQNYLYHELKNVKPGDAINITADGKTYNVITEIKDGALYTGITVAAPVMKVDSFLFRQYIIWTLTWAWLVSLLVGLFNVLPIPMLDGGLMIETLATKITKKYGKRIYNVVGLFTLLLIIYIAFGPLMF